uniref:S-adenosylmethionine mitochondrial carrier protein n=1 Tax=Caenorhabditis japonica TaxID=281687 RepID=A0A8R1HPE4_CAEJA
MPEDGSVVRWLVCGATAGLAVDIGLYPLDTIKSRMQSKQGFIAAGGFKDIYRGMSSVLVGSAPGAAIFFLTYKYINSQIKQKVRKNDALIDAVSASLAEIAACAVRVPTELCKQRAQVKANTRLSQICKEIMDSKGLRGFYQGYGSTVAREIPFSIIQFPIWEALKRTVAERKESGKCSPLEGAACGSVAGCIAAGLTTPLDVAKTRIMLTKSGPAPGILSTLKEVYTTGGMSGLYSGIVPRVMWISGGGFVFFGAYESAMHLTKFLDKVDN